MDDVSSKGLHAAFAERLKAALRHAHLTRGKLSEAMEQRGVSVSPSAWTQWLGGQKRPERDKIQLIAELTGVSMEWLDEGTPRLAPRDLESQRNTYRHAVKWMFRPAPKDGGRDYGNPNIWSFRPNIATLVRESGQNILDAAIDAEEGVSVTYRLTRLAGPDLARYLDALCWRNDQGTGLRDHLDAAAPADAAKSANAKLARVLRDGLNALDRNGELILLNIEDRRTSGLKGEEIGEGSFAALVRNNLDSSKADNKRAGGSFGLGKATYSLCSRFATTLYHSRLHDSPKYVLDENGQRRLRGRVIGKADLLWHTDKQGKAWAGPGWLGEEQHIDENLLAASVWENDALIEDLYLVRSTDGLTGVEGVDDDVPEHDLPGTTVQIVGLYDPSNEISADIQQLGNAIEREIATWFWPALVQGRLEASVALYEGSQRKSVRRVDADAYQPAFADAYRRRLKGLAKPEAPGDVATAQVVLRTPKSKVSNHKPEPHEAQLIVRLETDQDRQNKTSHDLAGHMAVFRGRGMVLAYRPIRQQAISGSANFHAILACGEAAGDTRADLDAEEFLRTAEPPSHDRWEPNPDVNALYVRGGGIAIRDMFASATQKVREMLRPSLNDEDAAPESMLNLLRIVGGGDGPPPPPPPPPSGTPRIFRVAGRMDAQGRWNVEATVRLPNTERWVGTPTLIFDSESVRDRQKGAWQKLEAIEGCQVDGGALIMESPRMRASFRAVSDPASHPVPGPESVILVELRNTIPSNAVRPVASSATEGQNGKGANE